MKHSFLFLLLFSFSLVQAQETYLLNGVIKDAGNNETLNGVNLFFPSLSTGTVSNDYGFYSIRLPEGEHQIFITYLGYQTISQKITISENTTLNWSLNQASEDLEEVVIIEDVERLNISRPQMSVNSLEISTIQKLPVVFGEVDIVRSLLLLPGVSNAGEASSGFNVRGGAADQNLILLDEATIFNASHLFGLFSVFNPDAIKNLKLYKGGIPADYGGRVSSVLDIYQKDGNSRNFEANGGIGLISSRLLLQGPIQKEKSSFLIGGRSSYAHLFLKLTDNENSAYFYDLNTKLSFRLDQRNTLLFSGYFGRDVFRISDSFDNTYGNAVFNLRWNHLLKDNIFSNLSLIYSDYYYGLTLDFVGFNWNSGIKNMNIKYDIDHHINRNLSLDYGVHNTYYEFNPGEIEPSSPTSGINASKLIKKYAFENAFYISAEQRLTKDLTAEYGLRYSSFLRLGQEELNLYTDDNPVVYNERFGIYEKAIPTGRKSLDREKVEKAFSNLEPRLALAYSFNENASVKASYNRMTQYLHLITNTSSPTPLDVWAPSGQYIEPQSLDQVAAGYYQNIKEELYSLEVEGFIKFLKNRIDYIDGANLIANNAIEQVILPGEARAYGLEVLLKKNKGDFTGWLAYTLSRSEQKTPGRTSAEPGINNSQWYNTPYDKTHDLSVTGTYDLNDRWSLNSNFIFQTGLPTTYPTGQYRFENLTIPVYSPRNSDRLPSYHRLDLSATYERPINKKSYVSSWTFGLYNVYSRKNAASMNFRRNDDTGVNEAVRLSIFGIVPAVTYNFKF
ncbi:TonB-dependent receptor [Salinimicrobium flavum]|uniref:isocitrate dehydrogenase (NADP(+)) n=1 Tax=Salinimicrobium flavum TaxID=1737065 RepID=A0ABW5J1C7_9FLAO